MPAVHIASCSQPKSILSCMGDLSSYTFLISYLECYDTEGWEGCEKWSGSSLLLPGDELKRDVDLRDMWFMWGAFSAIPSKYTKEEILAYPLPSLEDPRYMAERIVPQHPLAVFEISVWDGCYTYVSASDEQLLRPLYGLPYKVTDAEAENRRMNRELRRIQDALRRIAPSASAAAANEVQWRCWHELFRDKETDVSEDALLCEVEKQYGEVSADGYWFRYTAWDPYKQE